MGHIKRALLSGDDNKWYDELKWQFEDFLQAEVDGWKMTDSRRKDLLQNLNASSKEIKKRRGKTVQEATNVTQKDLFYTLVSDYYWPWEYDGEDVGVRSVEQLRADYVVFLQKQAKDKKHATDSYKVQAHTSDIVKKIEQWQQEQQYVSREQPDVSWKQTAHEKMKNTRSRYLGMVTRQDFAR